MIKYDVYQRFMFQQTTSDSEIEIVWFVTENFVTSF